MFKHEPKYASGGPRNIVYTAHWDGLSPFGTSGGHSTGVIDVKIAHMSKRKRCHPDQVFVVGFVPCFKTRDETPEFLDPFLTPLIDEIVDGFIDEIEVQYAADFPDFGIQKGQAVIRHLVFLGTSDHPGQCKVTNVKRTGKTAAVVVMFAAYDWNLDHLIITMEIVDTMQDTNGQVGLRVNQFP